MILALRTDAPQATVYLLDRSGKQLRYYSWLADRQLANELLAVVNEQLKALEANWQDIGGIIVYKGPGSFTGLRIGITVANTVAYSLQAPIVGVQGEDWAQQGIERLQANQDDRLVLPHYGAEANITLPKK